MDTITRAGGVRARALAFVLAVALAATLLPAVPASAEVTEACPSSLTDYGFTDIGGLTTDMRDAIDCVAYYGVARGVTTSRFDPQGQVTRWQMALFLVRTAEELGIFLPNGNPQGFTDIGAFPIETQRAINQLAQLDITKGTTATTYDPYAPVTRWQMALFLTRLAARVGVAMPNGNSQGYTDIGRFPFETQRAINQLTQLQIAKGTTATTYDPYGLTLRWQMALFLSRSLQVGGASPYRVFLTMTPNPATVIDTVTVTATVRRLDNVAVAGIPVDIFVASGLDSSGRCLLDSDARIDGGDAGTSDNCRIDSKDPKTNFQGEATVKVTHTTVLETDLVFVWVGESGETFDSDTVRTYASGQLVWASAPSAIAVGSVIARYGTQAKVTARLTDNLGKTLAVSGQRIVFEVRRGGSAILSQTVFTGTDGLATLSYTGPSDPTAGDDPTVVDTVVVFWDKDGDGKDDGSAEFDAAGTVTWDDDEPRNDSATLSQTRVTALAGSNHTVTILVTDKFGKPFPGAEVTFDVSGANTDSGTRTTDSQGKASFTFLAELAGASIVDAQVDIDGDGMEPEDLDYGEVADLTQYTVGTVDANLPGATEFVLLAVDTGADTIDVKEIGQDVYLRLRYDSTNDAFSVDGQARSRSSFETSLEGLSLPDLSAPPKLVTDPYEVSTSGASVFILTTK